MNERIRKIRRALDLTQQGFADRIGSKRNTIATYEIGRTTPSASVISLICREFNVNEVWLRTGEGEMFCKQSRTDELAAFMNSLLQSEPDDIRRRFVTAISHLSTKELEMLEKIALHLASELDSGLSAEPPAPEPDDDAAIEEAARQKAEAYYEQLLLESRTRTSAESTPAKTG